MRQRPLDLEIRPAIREPINCRLFCDVERVLIGLIDFGEGFDQIDGVGFIAGELRSDGMSVNRDAHDGRLNAARGPGVRVPTLVGLSVQPESN